MVSTFLQWIDAYAVGHDGLDAEHRRLADLINGIYIAECVRNTKQMGLLLEEVRQAAASHLRHENSVMREVRNRAAHAAGGHKAFLEAMTAAVIDEHIAEHARSLQQIGAIVHAFQSTEHVAMQPIGDALRDWFVEHAVKYDAHLKAVFQAM